MNQNWKKWLLAGFIFGVLTSCVYGDEAKGNKIVLASFSKMEEAKKSLDALGEKLTDSDREAQKKYHFDVVARPAGKAFIVGIEPLADKASADAVLKQFARLYPSAYVSGYYGPTEGSVFLGKESPKAVETVEKAAVEEEVNTTSETPVAVEAEAQTIVAKAVSEENTTAPREEEANVSDETEKKGMNWSYLLIAVVLLGLFLMVLRKFKKAQIKDFSETQVTPVEADSKEEVTPKAEVKVAEKKVESVVIADVPAAEVKIADAPKVEPIIEDVSDIFHRLTKNMFFKTLLEELKSAANSKNSERCEDLMEEVLRYQKNFRKSDVIASMQECVETKAFDRLSAIITHSLG